MALLQPASGFDGYTETRPKERKGAQGPYATELTPEKEAAIRAALIWFNLIQNE